MGIVQNERGLRYGMSDLEAMADQIVHRGPNDSGFHDGGRALIGMRRLSIIDLEGGQQPISNEDGSVWVVNNGEIYNFKSLRKRLEQAGHRFSTDSDTEVLVHLYEDHGEAFVEQLEGMFGVAIWDERKQKLIVARDRMGIKPIYFHQYPGGFCFASEIKSILSLPGYSTDINQRALVDHLSIGYTVAPETMFKGIERLPPAGMLVWENGSLKQSTYWEIPLETDNSLSFEEWSEQVSASFRDAVDSHLVSDVPLGAFLSGGIDSSAVAATMRNLSGGELNTYSIGYAGDSTANYYNELPYAKQVADQLDSNHREISVRPDVTDLLPKLMWHVEEPISDSAMLTTYLVSELAAESVTVILSGVGGDELFAGYRRYLGEHYQKYYRKIPKILRRKVLPAVAKQLPSSRQNRILDFSRYAKRFIEAGSAGWDERYVKYLEIANRQAVQDLFTSADSTNSLLRLCSEERADDELLRLLRVDWRSQLSENLLLLTDKVTMACSIECRVPFLDHKLVELASQIPARHKLPAGQLKGLLKHSFKGLLPDEIIDRRKRGFGAPVGSWFKKDLLSLRNGLLDKSTVSKRGLLDPCAVNAICSAHDSNAEDYTDLILVLINLEIWSRLFIDGHGYEEVADQLRSMSKAA